MPLDNAAPVTPVLASPLLCRFDALFGDAVANEALVQLDADLAWQQPRLRLFGREHPVPRRQVWMGDDTARYRYSGQTFTPEPWHPMASRIRDAVIARLGAAGLSTDFNSVLLNRYASGEERMGWHSDDEPELGADPVIAAVSLGVERPLRFRWKQGDAAPFNVWLPHDSLLVMGAGVQRQLQHALLPRKHPGLRISLTFRAIRYP